MAARKHSLFSVNIIIVGSNVTIGGRECTSRSMNNPRTGKLGFISVTSTKNYHRILWESDDKTERYSVDVKSVKTEFTVVFTEDEYLISQKYSLR